MFFILTLLNLLKFIIFHLHLACFIRSLKNKIKFLLKQKYLILYKDLK